MMTDPLPLPVACALGLGVALAFSVAVWHVDGTHRLVLTLMCLVGASVYLGMTAINVIYHDRGTVVVASALLTASAVVSPCLQRRGAELWPQEEADNPDHTRG